MARRTYLLSAFLVAAAVAACSSGGHHDSTANAAGTSADDSSGTDDSSVVPYDQLPAFQAAPPHLVRLLPRRYTNAVRALLGDAAATVAIPPPVAALNGSQAVGAATLDLGSESVAAFEVAARSAATAAVGDPASLSAISGCEPKSVTDDDCFAQFAVSLGPAAFRRPLEASEILALVQVADQAATAMNDPWAGVSYLIATLLQSPNFLYQVEIGEDDPDVPGGRRLTDLELATRMSFFLTDSPPDAAMLQDAVSGALHTDDQVRNWAAQLIARPAARAAITNALGEVVGLPLFEAIPKDGSVFPAFTPTLRQAMEDETNALLAETVWDLDTDIRAIFDADHAFVNDELADLYGLPEPGSATTVVRVALPADSPRRGLLGEGAILTTYAHPTTTSPTLRGKFILERLLCKDVGNPPNNVILQLPPDTQAKTMREKLAIHESAPSCAACHKLMDPVGLTLELFDGIGRYRTTDNGEPIDATGKGVANFGDLAGPADLAAKLRQNPDVGACVVRNLYRHATAHIELDTEARPIADLATSFSNNGFKVKSLLIELVASDGFRKVGPPDDSSTDGGAQ